MLPENLFDNLIEIDQARPLADSLTELPGRPGVCLMTTSDDRPVLVLYGMNLKLQVKRRLELSETGEKTKKADLRPLVAKVYYKMSYSKFVTQLDYFAIARAIYPQGWQKLFPRLNCWFITLDRQGNAPLFKLTDKLPENGEKSWGPFATKASADKLLETLIIVCRLCRDNKNLARAPQATPCSYAQMGLCPRVCDGTMSLADYELEIEKAIAFLDSPMPENIDRLNTEIQHYAGRLEFELAEKTHRSMQLCRKVTGQAYKWVGPMQNFLICSFQPDQNMKIEGQKGKQPGIKTILIRTTGPQFLPTFPLNQAQDHCQNMLNDIFNPNPPANPNQTPAENNNYLLAWLTQLLNNTAQQKGIFIPLTKNTTAEQLAHLLYDHFKTTQPETTETNPTETEDPNNTETYLQNEIEL